MAMWRRMPARCNERPRYSGCDHGRGEHHVIESRCAGGELDVLARGHQVGGQGEVCDQVVSVEIADRLAEHVQVTADEHLLVVLADVEVRVREATENSLGVAP